MGQINTGAFAFTVVVAARVVHMTCSRPLACALPPLSRHHRMLVDSRATSSMLAVGLVWTMICGGSCVVRTRRLACRKMRWRNWPSISLFRRGPCKLFGQQLDEVSLRLGIAPLPIKLHVIGIDRWLCELLPNPTSRS